MFKDKLKLVVFLSICSIIVIGILMFVKKQNNDLELGSRMQNVYASEKIDYEKLKSELNLKTIYLAGGCFWGVEEYMDRIPGVYDATSGYANGKTENPSYEEVIYDGTGHAETVRVLYDSEQVKLEDLLNKFFKVVDPTSLNKQGNDVGTQYRSGIYYEDEEDVETIEIVIEKLKDEHVEPIVVEVEPIDNFYLAEEYHQDYLKKNPNGYCHIDLSIAGGIDEMILENNYKLPSEEEIKEQLTDLQYKVTQEGGTERAFDNEYNDNKEPGIYVDIITGEPLFSSSDKYDSGSGWPSFTRPITENVINEFEDNTLWTPRIEVKSRSGDTHLGHVFNDGPKEEGGLRYCINSAALKFIHLDDMEDEGYGYLKYLVLSDSILGFGLEDNE